MTIELASHCEFPAWETDFFGIGLMIFAIGRRLFGSAVHGFPFLASSVTLFSGVQLFCIDEAQMPLTMQTR